MWAPGSWLWGSCSKKLRYITIKRFRKHLLERPSCFPADCLADWHPLVRAGWEALRPRHQWVRTSGWESLWVKWAGTWAWSPWGCVLKFDMKQDFLHGLEENFILFHFEKVPTNWILLGAQIRWDPRARCTQRTGMTLVLAYCNHRFSTSVCTPWPCSSPRQISLQLCQPLIKD